MTRHIRFARVHNFRDLADLTAGHGSIRSCAHRRLGIDEDLIAALRCRYLSWP